MIGNFFLVLWALCVIVGELTLAACGLTVIVCLVAGLWPGPHGVDRWL